MDDPDTLPRFTHDLIDLLDREVPRPQLPATIQGWSSMDQAALLRAAFASGFRSLVDQLVEQRDEEREAKDDSGGTSDIGVSDGPGTIFPRLFGPDGNIREITSPVSVDIGDA